MPPVAALPAIRFSVLCGVHVQELRDVFGDQRLEKWYPWAMSQPVSASSAACAHFSTPSATTSMPKVWPTSMTIRTMAVSSAFSPKPLKNDLSILRVSAGSRLR